MLKGDGFNKRSGTVYKVERLLEPTDFYRYQVVWLSEKGNPCKLALFRYKKHAEHFKAYLEVPCSGIK